MTTGRINQVSHTLTLPGFPGRDRVYRTEFELRHLPSVAKHNGRTELVFATTTKIEQHTVGGNLYQSNSYYRPTLHCALIITIKPRIDLR